MKSITITTTLNTSGATAWATVQRREAFVHVAGSMLRFPAAERHPGPWKIGDKLVGWMLLFRMIPFSHHTMEVVDIDNATMRMLAEEHGGLIRIWRHHIAVEPLNGDRCRYTDRVDIEAGILTPLVGAFAWVFYRYRQRRWRQLAPLLAASAAALRS